MNRTERNTLRRMLDCAIEWRGTYVGSPHIEEFDLFLHRAKYLVKKLTSRKPLDKSKEK